MSETQPIGAGRRAPRWLWGLLVLSLAVNLTVAGVVAGWALRPDRSSSRSDSQIVQMLPEARQAEARVLLAEARNMPDRRIEALIEANARVSAAIAAEPYDPQALEAALSSRMDLFRGRFDRRNAALAELVGRLNAAERQQFAEGMERSAERWLARMGNR